MANGSGDLREKKAELLHEHYKDTFQHIYDHWKVRNRLFGLILVILAAMLFQLTSPNVLERLANSYVCEQAKFKCPGADAPQAAEASAAGGPAAGEASPPGGGGGPPSERVGPGGGAAADNGPIDFRFITSLLWFVLASLLVQYYQRSILVDRMYTYIERVEGRLNDLVGAQTFTREGSFYETNKPKFLTNLFILYRWVFFALLLPVMLVKLMQEWLSTWDKGWPTSDLVFSAADTFIVLAILYYTALYLWWSHRERRPKKGAQSGSGDDPAPGPGAAAPAPPAAGAGQ